MKPLTNKENRFREEIAETPNAKRGVAHARKKAKKIVARQRRRQGNKEVQTQ